MVIILLKTSLCSPAHPGSLSKRCRYINSETVKISTELQSEQDLESSIQNNSTALVSEHKYGGWCDDGLVNNKRACQCKNL